MPKEPYIISEELKAMIKLASKDEAHWQDWYSEWWKLYKKLWK